VAELWFSEQADLALRTLESDPTRQRVLEEVTTYLNLLEMKPNNPHLRRRMYAGGQRRIDLRTDDWMIVWEPLDGNVHVRYIGQAL